MDGFGKYIRWGNPNSERKICTFSLIFVQVQTWLQITTVSQKTETEDGTKTATDFSPGQTGRRQMQEKRAQHHWPLGRWKLRAHWSSLTNLMGWISKAGLLRPGGRGLTHTHDGVCSGHHFGNTGCLASTFHCPRTRNLGILPQRNENYCFTQSFVHEYF